MKPNTAGIKKLIELFLLIFCYIQRSVPYPVIMREASNSSRLEQIQRLHSQTLYGERVFIKFLPSELKGSYGSGSTKILGSRGWRTIGEQSPLNELRTIPMSSQRHSKHRVYLSLHQVF